MVKTPRLILALITAIFVSTSCGEDAEDPKTSALERSVEDAAGRLAEAPFLRITIADAQSHAVVETVDYVKPNSASIRSSTGQQQILFQNSLYTHDEQTGRYIVSTVPKNPSEKFMREINRMNQVKIAGGTESSVEFSAEAGLLADSPTKGTVKLAAGEIKSIVVRPEGAAGNPLEFAYERLDVKPAIVVPSPDKLTVVGRDQPTEPAKCLPGGGIPEGADLCIEK